MNRILMGIATLGMLFVLLEALGLPTPLPYILPANEEGFWGLPTWYFGFGVIAIVMATRGLYKRYGVCCVAYYLMWGTFLYRSNQFIGVAHLYQPNRILYFLMLVTTLLVWLTSFPPGNMGEERLLNQGAFRIWAHPFYGSLLLLDATSLRPELLTVGYVVSMALLWAGMLMTCYLEECDTVERFGESALQYYQKTPCVHWLVWRFTKT